MRHYVMVFVWILAIAAVPLNLAAQKKGGGSKAKPMAKKAQSQVPKVNADDVFKKAFEAHVAGNQAEAIELFEFGLKRKPTDANGWYFLGVSKLAANNLDGAIATIGLGRGMGTPIQQARAEQIHDELSELKRALPRYSVRLGSMRLLAEALRLYQPLTSGKYRITSNEYHYFFDRAYARQKPLINCGYSVPQGMEAAISRISSNTDTLWPKLLHVGDGRTKSVQVSCLEGKKRESITTDNAVTIGEFVMLGTSGTDEGSLSGITGDITITGNPYVINDESEWSKTQRNSSYIHMVTTKSKLEGAPALLGPLGEVKKFRVHTESNFISEKHSSSSTSNEESRQTGVPFAAAYGMKRDRSQSSHSSDGSTSSYKDTRETVLSKTGGLDRPGDVLEFTQEIDRSGGIKIIVDTRVERLR